MDDRRREATELLTLMELDEAVGEALVAAYRGRHDVVEALGRRAAGGSAAPDELHRERRDLALLEFSRQVRNAPVVQVTDAITGRQGVTSAPRADLHRIQMELDQDEQDLDEAIRAALHRPTGASAGPRQCRSDDAPLISPRRRGRTVATLASAAAWSSALLLPVHPCSLLGLSLTCSTGRRPLGSPCRRPG